MVQKGWRLGWSPFPARIWIVQWLPFDRGCGENQSRLVGELPSWIQLEPFAFVFWGLFYTLWPPRVFQSSHLKSLRPLIRRTGLNLDSAGVLVNSLAWLLMIWVSVLTLVHFFQPRTSSLVLVVEIPKDCWDLNKAPSRPRCTAPRSAWMGSGGPWLVCARVLNLGINGLQPWSSPVLKRHPCVVNAVHSSLLRLCPDTHIEPELLVTRRARDRIKYLILMEKWCWEWFGKIMGQIPNICRSCPQLQVCIPCYVVETAQHMQDTWWYDGLKTRNHLQ